jgi:membrane-associated protease RseP (regulator of RpoE activity)
MSEPNSPISTSTFEYYHALPRPVGRPPRGRYWLHALLLTATCFTTLIMGARMQYNFANNRPALTFSDERVDYFPVGWIRTHPERILGGLPFATTVMLFFLAHELGHYLCCRRYRVYATLPFFIPMPTPIGTMGAVILIRSPIRSRAGLFDIAIAGPIAGFVVASITLVISLTLSKPLPHGAGAPDYQLAFPLIFDWAHRLLVWSGMLRGGAAMPLERVLLHPTAIAAWVGMFATALNLLPSSQLDGGHIVYALAPRAHRIISWITVIGVVYLGRSNHAMWFWAAVLVIMNVLTYRQEQAPEYPMLPASRWPLAVLALIMLAVTLTISPIQMSWR